jgi:hypothetical protein
MSTGGYHLGATSEAGVQAAGGNDGFVGRDG